MTTCLSIHEPWASLIIHGATDRETGKHVYKDVENRNWTTNHRGKLVIHATKKFDITAWINIRSRFVFYDTTGREMSSDDFPVGCLLGTVNLVDAIRAYMTGIARSDWHELGLVGLYLEEPRPFPRPVPWKGQLGLWQITEAKLAQCMAGTACREPEPEPEEEPTDTQGTLF